MKTTNKKFLVVFISALVCTGVAFLFCGVALAVNEYAPEIKTFDGQTAKTLGSFYSFPAGFKGGAFVATGDITGTGKDKIITGAGPTGGPQMLTFWDSGQFLGFGFYPFAQSFSGGVEVAACDLDGDGTDEIVVAQAGAGQAWIKAYEVNQEKTVIAEFIALNPSFKGGANIACGDINKDGRGEILVGAGIGGGPQVMSYDLSGRFVGFGLFPFSQTFKGGVDVAIGNLDRDSDQEVVVSQASNGQAWVKVYKADSHMTLVSTFLAYGEGHKGGARVTVGDVDGNGVDEIITSVASQGSPQVRVLDMYGRKTAPDILVYPDAFRGGVDVAAGDVNADGRDEIITAPRLGVGLSTGECRRGDVFKYIDINLTEQKLVACESTSAANSFLVSTGLPIFPTRPGNFSVTAKYPVKRYTGYYGAGSPHNYDLPNVWWNLRFDGPRLIHGTYWHSNFGHPMSHGCVNSPTNQAKWLYDWAPVGTPVYVHY